MMHSAQRAPVKINPVPFRMPHNEHLQRPLAPTPTHQRHPAELTRSFLGTGQTVIIENIRVVRNLVEWLPCWSLPGTLVVDQFYQRCLISFFPLPKNLSCSLDTVSRAATFTFGEPCILNKSQSKVGPQLWAGPIHTYLTETLNTQKFELRYIYH